MIVLAIQTGIAPSAWAAEGEQAIVTALEHIDEMKRAQQRQIDQALG